jgi:non-specific serine/threonine protein kinase
MVPAPVLTPDGSLALTDTGEALTLDAERGARLQRAFARGAGHGLLSLGIDEIGAPLPPVLAYWREIGTQYATALCALPTLAKTAQAAGPASGRQ